MSIHIYTHVLLTRYYMIAFPTAQNSGYICLNIHLVKMLQTIRRFYLQSHWTSPVAIQQDCSLSSSQQCICILVPGKLPVQAGKHWKPWSRCNVPGLADVKEKLESSGVTKAARQLPRKIPFLAMESWHCSIWGFR